MSQNEIDLAIETFEKIKGNVLVSMESPMSIFQLRETFP